VVTAGIGAGPIRPAETPVRGRPMKSESNLRAVVVAERENHEEGQTWYIVRLSPWKTPRWRTEMLLFSSRACTGGDALAAESFCGASVESDITELQSARGEGG
jgi:hypothetical protein